MYILCMKELTLTPEEREFCCLVSQAGIANHFSAERVRLDQLIGASSATVDRQSALRNAMERLDAFIRSWEAQGRANFLLYSSSERQLVEFTMLFDLFHRFLPHFDRHIVEQVAAGDRLVEAPFAAEALALFAQRGFDPDESVLYFEIFFQLRRAYYFIENQLVGASPCMIRLREDLWNNIFTFDQLFYKSHLIGRMEDFSTLLLGATGSGKGAAAAAIGRSGLIPFDRRTNRFTQSFMQAFVAINLSQYPQTLIESELFGHRKGAFTGAIDVHQGIFERCSRHGAIFLDEIGDVEPPVQLKLLHILQERIFYSVGSYEPKRFEGRVIGATNRDIVQLRRSGRFRDDFYYRLCSDTITVPTLYERLAEYPGELAGLVRHLLQRIASIDDTDVAARVESSILSAVGRDYRWPGNVRELEQAVRSVIIRNAYRGGSSVSDGGDRLNQIGEQMRSGKISADRLLAEYCAYLYRASGSYEAVGERVKLDRRTVKRYIDMA
jgi:DNA-binding NtrC family response regulator